jgi:hypothetical protein
MSLFSSIKKRSLFLLGIASMGVIGMVRNFWQENYSKENSLLVVVPTAHADYADYSGSGDSGPGDGCGGCTGDSSY